MLGIEGCFHSGEVVAICFKAVRELKMNSDDKTSIRYMFVTKEGHVTTSPLMSKHVLPHPTDFMY